MTGVGPESKHEKYKGPVVMRRSQVDGTTTYMPDVITDGHE